MHLHHFHLLHNMKVKYVHTPFFHFHTHLILYKYNIHHYSILVYIFLEIGLFIAHWAICNFFWGGQIRSRFILLKQLYQKSTFKFKPKIVFFYRICLSQRGFEYGQSYLAKWYHPMAPQNDLEFMIWSK